MIMSGDKPTTSSSDGGGDVAKELFERLNSKLPALKQADVVRKLLSGNIFSSTDQSPSCSSQEESYQEAPGILEELEASIGDMEDSPEDDADSDDAEEDPEFSRLLFSRSILIDCLARRDFNLLADRCMEALRRKKYVGDACKFLGLLFEEVGDADRYLTFTILSLLLKGHGGGGGSDVEDWMMLSHLSAERGNLHQAVYCITQAMKRGKKAAQLLYDRGSWYQQLGKHKLAIADYCAALDKFTNSPADKKKLVNTFHNLSKIYYNTGEINIAIDCLLSVFNNHAELVTSVEVNYLIDLYIEVHKYTDALTVLSKFCQVTFTYPDREGAHPFDIDSGSQSAPLMCFIDKALSIDLRVKTIICLNELGYTNAIGDNLNELYELDVGEVGDLYLDLIESFCKTAEYGRSIVLFEHLLPVANYKDDIGLLMKYSECLRYEEEVERAIAVYEHILAVAPTHDLARLHLTSLQHSIGEVDGAMQLIASHHITLTDLPVKEETFALLIEKCNLLHREKNYDKFIKEAKTLLDIFCTSVPLPLRLPGVLNTAKHVRQLATQMRKDVLCNILELNLSSDYNVGVLKSVWEVFHKLCQVLAEKKMNNHLLQVAYLVLHCPFFYFVKSLCERSKLMCAIAALRVHYYNFAMQCARSVCVDNPYSPVCWNLLNCVTCLCGDKSMNRGVQKFVRRVFNAHPSSVCVVLEDAHRAAASSMYKHALISYMYVFQRQPDNPLIALLLAVTYLNMTHNKFVVNKHTLVVQSIAFFNHYLQTRGECQETYYNIGRAMSHWGLNYLAISYYKKALQLRPPAVANNTRYDLSHEIGYNLATIYKLAGNHAVARYYMQKYCVI